MYENFLSGVCLGYVNCLYAKYPIQSLVCYLYPLLV